MEKTALIQKTWGYEKIIVNNEKYCMKELHLNKNFQCSLHYHQDKDETFYVQSGHVFLEVESFIPGVGLQGTTRHLKAGDIFRLRPGTWHRFTGIENSLIIEVSTTDSPMDSYRREKSRKVIDINKFIEERENI